ncbi:MAG: allophanate hydrolase [Caldimonas sp.]
MDVVSLSTVVDWTAAYAAGASPRELLEAQRQRLANGPDAVWIARASTAQIESQIDALEARAASFADRAAVLAALPLFGVPFAVKDNIDVAGFPTTAACPAFAYLPRRHAGTVAKLIEAGAVCLGKTNLDQFATGLVGARSPYGRPSSALAPDRISGGSSSGSAVAVARGDVAFALGTDTAGSGRIPAGFNNIVGLKPTPGRVGTSGVVPACRSLDCVSIFALTVADAARILALIEGPDVDDAYSAFSAGPAQFNAPLRIGVPSQAVFSGDAGYGATYEAAVAQLQALGHSVVALDFEPLHAVAALLYGGPWVAERHAVVEALLTEQPEAFDRSVRSVIEAARGMSATDAFRGLYALRDAQREVGAIWNEVDLLMVPTASGHPRHTEVDADPIGVNAELGRYTNFVNLLGWCALALPAGFTSHGLPFGVTLIAPAARDAALARFGMGWQESVALPLGATDARLGSARGKPTASAASTSSTSSVSTKSSGSTGSTPSVAPTASTASSTAAVWPASRPTLPIAVVGAHLSGLPLNSQLVERGATLRETTQTAPHYRLYALPGTTPPKPGLLRVPDGGVAIAVEVWDMPTDAVGSFLALIPAPLGLGSIELADGGHVHGFLCEAHALTGAADISAHGGWRAYLASLRAAAARTA